MIKDRVHEAIVENIESLEKWFAEKANAHPVPFYSSFDIRDSGEKIATVDANVFPAGFNNICQVDQESAPSIIADQKSLAGKDKILLLTEAHTSNLYYWDNVATIRDLLTEAGKTVRVAVPLPDFQKQTIESASGLAVEVYPIGDLEGFVPDLTISNNDLTQDPSEWPLVGPMNPPKEFGWYKRRKQSYFHHYNELVSEFAELLKMDPEHFLIHTQQFENFDVSDEASKKRLGERVDKLIGDLQSSYSKAGLEQKPFVFLKNSSGTYGLGVMPVSSGQEAESMSYKARKKMKAAKGGGDVSELILQEGIPSVVSYDEGTAEPVIYMVGTDLVGGFLRTHKKKGDRDSLNSPGAVYERLCVSDLKINLANHPLENVYGWLAKIGALAIAREGTELEVQW